MILGGAVSIVVDVSSACTVEGDDCVVFAVVDAEAVCALEPSHAVVASAMSTAKAMAKLRIPSIGRVWRVPKRFEPRPVHICRSVLALRVPDRAICAGADADSSAVLIVMSGLPGVGKSALADELGRRLPACVVSVDPIEDAMLRAGLRQSFETGVAAYEVGATVAVHQLALGLHVVADAANYLEVGRDTWRRAASSVKTAIRVVHVVCSDETLHRRRLGERKRGLARYPEPTWDEVELRRSETERWVEDHLVVDSRVEMAVNVETCVRYFG
ncbi:MAG: hypothetical protein QOE62_3392 [Actinomycetota bacterium]|jgi:predicted kinase|nr:hypothetical protein [Actinomycetota bacterium]